MCSRFWSAFAVLILVTTSSPLALAWEPTEPDFDIRNTSRTEWEADFCKFKNNQDSIYCNRQQQYVGGKKQTDFQMCESYCWHHMWQLNPNGSPSGQPPAHSAERENCCSWCGDFANASADERAQKLSEQEAARRKTEDDALAQLEKEKRKPEKDAQKVRADLKTANQACNEKDLPSAIEKAQCSEAERACLTACSNEKCPCMEKVSNSKKLFSIGWMMKCSENCLARNDRCLASCPVCKVRNPCVIPSTLAR